MATVPLSVNLNVLSPAISRVAVAPVTLKPVVDVPSVKSGKGASKEHARARTAAKPHARKRSHGPGRLKRAGFEEAYARQWWPADVDWTNDETLAPLTARPEDMHLVVTGGEGRFTAVCPGWGSFGGLAVTRGAEFYPPALPESQKSEEDLLTEHDFKQPIVKGQPTATGEIPVVEEPPRPKATRKRVTRKKAEPAGEKTIRRTRRKKAD